MRISSVLVTQTVLIYKDAVSPRASFIRAIAYGRPESSGGYSTLRWVVGLLKPSRSPPFAIQIGLSMTRPNVKW